MKLATPFTHLAVPRALAALLILLGSSWVRAVSVLARHQRTEGEIARSVLAVLELLLALCEAMFIRLLRALLGGRLLSAVAEVRR